MAFPFYREFYQGQGTAVQGTWVWTTNANQTDFASVTGEGAGYFINNTTTNLDEYKWGNIFLTHGTYKITIIGVKAVNRGIHEVLFGNTSLGTKDGYNAATLYNQLWEIPFTVTEDKTADMRFRVNGKNAASTGYYAEFSRYHIEKTG